MTNETFTNEIKCAKYLQSAGVRGLGNDAKPDELVTVKIAFVHLELLAEVVEVPFLHKKHVNRFKTQRYFSKFDVFDTVYY